MWAVAVAQASGPLICRLFRRLKFPLSVKVSYRLPFSAMRCAEQRKRAKCGVPPTYEMRSSTEASTGRLLRVSRNFSRLGV